MNVIAVMVAAEVFLPIQTPQWSETTTFENVGGNVIVTISTETPPTLLFTLYNSVMLRNIVGARTRWKNAP